MRSLSIASDGLLGNSTISTASRGFIDIADVIDFAVPDSKRGTGVDFAKWSQHKFLHRDSRSIVDRVREMELAAEAVAPIPFVVKREQTAISTDQIIRLVDVTMSPNSSIQEPSTVRTSSTPHKKSIDEKMRMALLAYVAEYM